MDKGQREAYYKWLHRTIQSKKENLTDEDVRKILVGQYLLPADEMDFELIDACVDYFDADDKPNIDPQQVKTKNNLLQRIAREETAGKQNHFSLYRRIKPIITALSFLRRYCLRIAVFALAFIVLWAGYDIILNPNSVIRRHSSDGEDYIIQAANQDNELIPNSRANIGERETKELAVTDLNQVFTELKYKFALPSWMPEGVDFTKADVVIGPTSDMATIRYNQDEKQIVIIVERFYSTSGTSTYYEQNEPGKIIELSNGNTAYIAQNIDVPWGICEIGDFTYHISCQGYSEDTLIKIINSIGDGKK